MGDGVQGAFHAFTWERFRSKWVDPRTVCTETDQKKRETDLLILCGRNDQRRDTFIMLEKSAKANVFVAKPFWR